MGIFNRLPLSFILGVFIGLAVIHFTEPNTVKGKVLAILLSIFACVIVTQVIAIIKPKGPRISDE